MKAFLIWVGVCLLFVALVKSVPAATDFESRYKNEYNSFLRHESMGYRLIDVRCRNLKRDCWLKFKSVRGPWYMCFNVVITPQFATHRGSPFVALCVPPR